MDPAIYDCGVNCGCEDPEEDCPYITDEFEDEVDE